MGTSLLEEARRLAAGKTGTRCGLGKFLERLEPKERAEWEELVGTDKDDVPHTVIAVMLQARDVAVQDHTVGTHRRGRCMCGKQAVV